MEINPLLLPFTRFILIIITKAIFNWEKIRVKRGCELRVIRGFLFVI